MNDIELLEQQAIDAAINLQWKDALKLNTQIIKLDKKNEAAHLRMGFIYLQMKDIANAKKYYSKALKIQPKSSVAIQNIERIKVLEKAKIGKNTDQEVSFDPDLFMEVAGKTKIVALSNLGQKNILARLTIGQKVELLIKKRRVEVRTTAKEYIGALPDDLSKRLIFFLKAKSSYATYIKEATLTRVIVFIREEKKGKQVMSQVSFPQNIQKKLDEFVLHNADEKEEEGVLEEQDEHMEGWEKMAAENPILEEKDLLIDIQRDDLEDEE